MLEILKILGKKKTPLNQKVSLQATTKSIFTENCTVCIDFIVYTTIR